MSALQDARRKLSHNELLDSLNDRQRRRILRQLDDRSGTVTERELAEKLVAEDRNEPVEDVPEGPIEGVRIQLQHVHLPQLNEAGLLDWDEGDETVASTDTPVWDDREFQRLIEMDDEEWDDVVGSMTDGRLDKVLAVLESDGQTVRRDVLAHRIAAREADGESWADAVEAVRTELHHVHLPKLEGAGLVEYNDDDGTVTYQDVPTSEGWER